MDTDKSTKIETKVIVRTLSIISFIAICTFIIMKLIDKESDSLSIFFVGFALIVLAIVLSASYLNYVINIYRQIRKSKNKDAVKELEKAQNEIKHMKIVHQVNNKKQKNKGSKRKR